MAAAALLRLVSILVLIAIIEGRFLRLNSSDDHLTSDGVDHIVHNQTSSVKTLGAAPPIPTTCDHQYGFLPCAENPLGYIFQIVVYQLLLTYGGQQIGSGSKVLFSILGVGKFGGIIFRILMSLPSMVLMIVSGVFSSKENAQSQVSFGVGLYAGSTVFSLTLQWGICVIFGRRKLDNDHSELAPQSSCFLAKEKLTFLTDIGVKTDPETRTTAGIVVLSLVPYVIVQLVNLFHTASGVRAMTLIALIVSTLSLLSYFAYQILYPKIQERSLHYTKYEVLRTGFLKHIQRQGQLVNEQGKLNTDVIKNLFDNVDKDDDHSITKTELSGLVLDIIRSGKVKVDEKFAMAEVMKVFDSNDDRSITEEEFVKGCKKWIDETNNSSENHNSSSKDVFQELLEIFKENKENDPKEIDRIMSKILKHAQTQLLKSESLIGEDGKPNVGRIQTLFKQFDLDGDKSISFSELNQLISTVKFGEMKAKSEDTIMELFKDFDKDGDQIINEPEFIEGVSKWLNKAISVAKTSDKSKAIDEFDKIVWKKTLDKRAFFVSIFQLALGIVMLTFLGGPLMNNILQLSFAMNLSSFSISFVIVPVAMNARAAIAALMPASEKNEISASLTFSEIYGTVIMNNVAGLTTLLAIVYAKDLRWDFSAEVLTILFVGAVIGILAYRCKTYPLWTCILAFALYPFSLTLYYLVQLFFKWN
ncbi:sodium/calcium exchanger NCL1-like [Andrographis paniculata]|uniref:sodium/calcium exchanger NCL1-like n=1 Tax=Andrographis paniculata TaxID=175694 RepID=UPI0021E94775|nr:sodium/calcium exchanger NCL1-like [Andrographis paniculata]